MSRGAKPGERRGGRSKGTPNRVTADIKAIAQSYGEEAITVLVEIFRDKGAPPQARTAASKELLDRGYGKARQDLNLSSDDGTMSPKGLSDFYGEK